MSEEEDEIVIEAGSSDDDIDEDEEIIITDDDDPPPPREKTQAEKDKEELEALKRKYNPKSGSEIRILNDLRESQKANEKDLGFRCLPYKGTLSVWEVQLFGFDKKDPIFQDMQKYKQMKGKDYIELRVSFPPEYPNHPPFIRVVEPRCVSRTGRITLGGSICTDVLTLSETGWKPMYDFNSLFSNIITEMLACQPKLRIDFNNMQPYSVEESKQAFARVASDHGWKINNWNPK